MFKRIREFASRCVNTIVNVIKKISAPIMNACKKAFSWCKDRKEKLIASCLVGVNAAVGLGISYCVWVLAVGSVLPTLGAIFFGVGCLTAFVYLVGLLASIWLD